MYYCTFCAADHRVVERAGGEAAHPTAVVVSGKIVEHDIVAVTIMRIVRE